MALPQPHDDAGAARGDLGRARQALAETAKHTDDLIASLPEPGKRSAKQAANAAAAHDVIRTVRSHFMDLHAEAVYDELTDHRTRYLRLPELVEAAAVAFPGLVPTADQMTAERSAPAGPQGGP